MVVLVLGVFGVWANVGAALTPSALWTYTQAKKFLSYPAAGEPGVHRRRWCGTVRPLPVLRPGRDPVRRRDCSGLYLSTGFGYETVPGQQLQHETWVPVEQGPGINHLVARRVQPDRCTRGQPVVTLLTCGKSSLVLIPTGTTGRTGRRGPGRPLGDLAGGQCRLGSRAAPPGYEIEVMTDPNLNAIVAGGMGVGIVHYLAGTGPAVVATDAAGRPLPRLATVTDVTGARRRWPCAGSLVQHRGG